MKISPKSFAFGPLIALALLVVPLGCSQHAKLENHLASANEHFAAGNFQSAEIEYKNVLQIDSNIGEAIGNLGLIYFNQGRLVQAYPFLTHVRDLLPENLEYRSHLSALLQQAGKPQEAWDEALFILDNDPGNRNALFALQAAALDLRKIGEARAELEKRQAAQASAGNLVALGMLDAIESDFDTAETKFREALQMDPNLGEAHIAMASLYWARGDLKAADSAYRQSYELVRGQPSKQLLYAQFKFRNGETDAANEIIDEILASSPSSVPTLTLKAQLKASKTQYEDAAKLSEEILRLTPNNPEAILLSSRLKLAQNEIDTAVAQLEQAIERYPEADALIYQLALAQLANNEPIKSSANLTRTIAINPNHNEAILMMAALDARQGDPESAIVSLEEVVLKNNENIQAQTLLAQIHFEAGHLDEALNLYQALGKQLKNNPGPPQLAAEALIRIGKEEEARAALANSLERDPNYLVSLARITDLDIADRRFDEAISRIDMLFEKVEEPAHLHMLKGKTLLAAVRDAPGEIELKRAIELKPTLRDAHLYLAVHYTIAKKPAEALAKYRAMIDINPNDTEALMRAGAIHEQQKDFAAARSSYEKVVEVNRNHSAALNNLAYISAEHYDLLDKAHDLAMRARSLSPADPAIADTLGWIAYKRGDYELALGLIKESAAKIAQHPEIQYHLGKAHLALEEKTSAKAAFERALDLGLEGDLATEAVEILRSL